jgi:hypothetical protein
MKINKKTNSQVRTEKEKLVMENFASVMNKLDSTFLIEGDDGYVEKEREHTEGLNEITPAQQRYVDIAKGKPSKPKPTKFRSDINGAKKMIDAGKSQEEVISKYGIDAFNAVNAENDIYENSDNEVNEVSNEKKAEHALDIYNRSDFGDSVSNCCGSKFKQGDICSSCGEHAVPSTSIDEGLFGSSVDKVMAEYISKLNSFKLEVKPLDWDLGNEAIDKLKGLNITLDELLTNKSVLKYLRKNDLIGDITEVKANVGVNPYGMNRPDGLYLGNTNGLFTKTISDWIDVNDDEAKVVVVKQLVNWINSNIDKAISLLTPVN